jgi:hypothetical protein|tara:strand:+ start:115 stop:267 length:153 start_codon:yes stop_codon:yes gene_type:complete
MDGEILMNDFPNINLDNLGEDANLLGKPPPCKIGQYGFENNDDITARTQV